jgi:hypothetical protein
MRNLTLCLLLLGILLGGCKKKNVSDDDPTPGPPVIKGGKAVVWVNTAGGTFTEYGQEVVCDQAGNLYITGYFNGTATFGNTTLTAIGENNTFIAKVNPSGNFIWAKRCGGTSKFTNDYPNSITIGQDQKIYVTGMFDYGAAFGSISLSAHNGSTDIFIAKMDTAGNFLWAKNAGGDQNGDISLSICSGPGDDIYISGEFYTKAWFGNIELSADNQGHYAFLASMDQGGNFKWAKKAGITTLLSVTDVATDQAGDLYFTGSYFGNENLLGVSLDSTSPYGSTYVAKASKYGEIDWVQRAGSDSGGIFGTSISVDPSGRIFISGHFIKQGIFGSTTLSSATKEAFWAELDVSGNWLWARQSRTNKVINENYCLASDITADAKGNLFLIGTFMGSTSLGSQTFDSHNYDIGFWAALNADGSIRKAFQTDPTGNAGISGVAGLSDSSLVITGYYGNKAGFDSIQPAWRGGTDVFILKSKP